MGIPIVDQVVAFIDWVAATFADILYGRDKKQTLIMNLKTAPLRTEADLYFNNAAPELQADPEVIAAYENKKQEISNQENDLLNPLTKWLGNVAMDFLATDVNNLDPLAQGIDAHLTNWKKAAEGFQNTSADEAQKKLAALTAKTFEIFAASAAIDVGLGLLPNGAGTVSTWNTKKLLTMMGFSAVALAAFHDPVKIGILRPYQDNLEATFRNRRPDYNGILNAYKQRSLSTIPITDIDQITDAVMDKVEADNNKNMDDYGAQWGYPQKWITIEKDAATRALTFGNLSSMARMGHYDRKMSIFSLWTYGLDRRLMVASLDALETMRDVGLWKGFRSMVEPGYVQGVIDEADLKEYWNRILVPLPVQEWTLLRLKKARERYAEKEAKSGLNKQRDLTRADFAKAYLEGIIDLATFEAKLAQLGYDPDEITVIVKLTENSRKTATASKCKRLPLSDYELAHRNGIRTIQQVLDRMVGEYCPEDIELEKQLLEIDDLTSDAPARERDLSVSQITQVYVDGDITKPELDTYLEKLGFDEQERAWLIDLADVKKAAADAKADKAAGKAAVVKDRDLTRADFTFEFVHNRISEDEYRVALTQLRYDKKEIDMIVDIANVKKKIPTIEGTKHLPLTDYEKMYKNGKISLEDLLDSMKGIYTERDIQLERLGILEGVL